ncbi:GMC family oxidoreductase N-terminal domain-containing protein [Massilia antarctica]|uniref:GMC family oxidoreductase N-terminal domain-containing protein n=1 Tax=Massilia antarctica TaxID=2765360 RepID=UPI0006BB5C25|nr:GMC oxidoreductase [Massilia sp. H27-R4]MCY0915384.1 GMC oxidoreductase [Massilia sp. H27-R4]CUI05846.1 Cholesterol oxidase [Janthinobacterium sp. CG23_2]CUU29632.1 Cholesterol oxidase [Janthinobacterium sp. CG23_2]
MSDSIKRRHFMAALGSLVAGASLAPSPARAATAPPRTQLSRAPGQLASVYDVLVIGSGYGGAVMAARLAPGRSLAVLERGKEWSPDAFATGLVDTLAQFRTASAPLGLFDYRAGGSIDVLSGNGVGGTSLINANVVLAPDRDIFGRWPQAIQDAYASGAMDGYEARVRTMLGADTVTEADALRKSWFHLSTTAARKRQGTTVQARALAVAVNLRRYQGQPNAQGVWQAACTHCGDCVTGCRIGAKNSLDVNYLPLARSGGAQIFARIEVDWIERLTDNRWRVHYLGRPESGPAVAGSVIAASVIVAAGSLGSTQILLRSQARGLALSPALGTRFSTNGDLLGLAYNTRVQTNIMGFGAAPAPFGLKRVGPTITAMADYRAAGTPVAQRYLIQDAAIPSSLVDALRLAMPLAAPGGGDVPALQRIARDIAKRGTDGALNHSMVYLGIGHDSASGKVELDASGNARVLWPGIANEPFGQRMRAEMALHAQAFGGRYADSPRSSPLFGGAMTTVHPLGGCPMADRVEDGVVDADGRVFNPRGAAQAVYPGLRVIDGAIAPSSLGANPLLTIAALAERAAERFSQ